MVGESAVGQAGTSGARTVSNRRGATDHRIGAHDHQGVAPVEESWEYRQWDSPDGIDSPRLHAPLDVQGELPAQEQHLCAGAEG